MSQPAPNEKDYDGDYAAAFKGEHLAAADFTRPITLRIKRITQKKIAEGKGKKEKLTIYLEKLNGQPVDRGWLPAKTACACLGGMFGREAKGWKGKRVTLYRDPDVRFGTDVTGGIRVLGSPDIEGDMPVRVVFVKSKFTLRMKKTVVGSEASIEIEAPIDEDDEPPMSGPPPRDEPPPREAGEEG